MAKPRTGDRGLVGEIGTVKKALAPDGKVFVHGELWFARSASTLAEGTKVRVVKMDNLTLEVEPVDSNFSEKGKGPE
ncbi:MAG: NfeD family protein [Deltaproteobacteria bacterium]